MNALSRAVLQGTKQALILDALRAADCRCGDDASFLQIFFDYLVIYLHGSAKLVLSSADRSISSIAPLFENFEEYWCADELITDSKSSSLTLSIAAYKASGRGARPLLSEYDSEFIRLLIRKYSQRIAVGVAAYETSFPRKLSALDKDLPTDTGMVDPIRHQLDAVFRDFLNADILFDTRPGSDAILPLFAVVRHPSQTTRKILRSSIPYTPYMLLSRGQLSALTNRLKEISQSSKLPTVLESLALNTINENAVREVLEAPLKAKASLSLADFSLLSGTADIVCPGGQRSTGMASVASGALEVILYRDLCSLGDPFFFIPVHIGRTPWITFYTVQSRPMQSHWLRLFHLYRDVVPYIAGSISAAVHTAFVNALVQSASRQGFRAGEETREEDRHKINSDWKALSQHFPMFQEVTLEASGVKVTALNTGPAWRVGDERTFEQQVWGDLQKRKSCESLGRDIYRSVLKSDKLHLEHDGHYEVIDLTLIGQKTITLDAVYSGVVNRLEQNNGGTCLKDWIEAPQKDSDVPDESRRLVVLLLLVYGHIRARTNEDPDGATAEAMKEKNGSHTGRLQAMIGRTQGTPTKSIYKSLQDLAGQLCVENFADLSATPMPYRPFVERFIEKFQRDSHRCPRNQVAKRR